MIKENINKLKAIIKLHKKQSTMEKLYNLI